MPPKIDAHQHFWVYNPVEYTWIDESMAVLKRDFLPEHLQPLLLQQGFDGSIAVQARQKIEETEWLLQLAEENHSIKGVVGWVNLCSDDLEIQLDQLSVHHKLVGVRHVVQDEPDDDFMLRDDFQFGIRKLAAYKLTYDLLIYPRHLTRAIRLVRSFPGQTFILDHMAKPTVKTQEIQPWKQHIEQLAELHNVFCKISGMVTEADWHSWKSDDFSQYMDVVINAFGTNRIMIGSDWPVCSLAGKYNDIIGLAKDYLSMFSGYEQEMVLGSNAIKAYSLPC
ncbi:MAG: amidohydrolase family protein [Bacteroidales bacterium]|nr:amidohydrolase family protein [Bacteroidales bacterium]